jgi:hypothetical protein
MPNYDPKEIKYWKVSHNTSWGEKKLRTAALPRDD